MQAEVPNVKLLDQYRMHYTISSQPNAMFYNKELRDCVDNGNEY